jgi:hypothetical protein
MTKSSGSYKNGITFLVGLSANSWASLIASHVTDIWNKRCKQKEGDDDNIGKLL